MLTRLDGLTLAPSVWTPLDMPCKKYLWLLQRTEKQVKPAAELYKPNRFQGG